MHGDKYLPTFLYLHGGPGVGSYDFNLVQAQRLSSFVRLISIDQRGCLRSDAIEEDEEFSLQNLIDDFEAIRNYFEIDRWGLIGHSFGGYLAIEYAYQYPEVIEQMVLECPTFDFIESFRSVVKMAENIYREDGQDEIANRCKDAYTYSLEELDKVFSYDISEKRDQVYIRALNPKFFNDIIEKSGLTQSDWQKQMMFQKKLNGQIFNQPNLEKLNKITCPVLLIKGKYDPICSENQTDEFLKKVQNRTIVICDNSAHMPRHEEPELFAETIELFVRKNQR
ncbi:alpha/beta fold hydrolase [Paenibacillus sp. MBLB4367]|uniref:alpha/beta fold hydrolase n=1 Tax=Paenibacillus sp. MBLB4367 TaxID=3384767 RepID=UPI003907E891